MPSNELYQSFTPLITNIFLVSLLKISNYKRKFTLFTYFTKPCWNIKGYEIYHNNRFLRFAYLLISWTFLINFTLIVIVNPSIINPGPLSSPQSTSRSNCITVAYQKRPGSHSI